MDRTFKRVENIDERVKEVKLPYNAWKVLFVIDGETTLQQIAEKLDEETSVVEDALRHLTDTQLVIESQPLPEEKIEEVAEETISEEPVEEKIRETPEKELHETEEETEEVVKEEAGLEPEEMIEEEPLLESEEEPLVAMEEEPPAEFKEESTLEQVTTEKEPEPEIIMDEQAPVETEEKPSEPQAEVEQKEEDIVPEVLLEENSEVDLDLAEDIEGAEQLDVDFAETIDTEESIVSAVEEQVEEKAEPVTEEPPVAEKEEPAAPVTPPEQPELGDRKKILVIDDSIVIRKMVEIALEDEEYKLSSAVSGKDGLDKLDQVQPDLVVLDLMLPDINGIDILKTIKQSRQIPVIMLSGKDSPQMVEKAKSAGADAFLPKPFKDEELKEQIKKLFTA